jgi:hypothetical protein
MSVSLDGFVADPHHGVGQLFGYAAGDVEVPGVTPGHPAVPRRPRCCRRPSAELRRGGRDVPAAMEHGRIEPQACARGTASAGREQIADLRSSKCHVGRTPSVTWSVRSNGSARRSAGGRLAETGRRTDRVADLTAVAARSLATRHSRRALGTSNLRSRPRRAGYNEAILPGQEPLNALLHLQVRTGWHTAVVWAIVLGLVVNCRVVVRRS